MGPMLAQKRLILHHREVNERFAMLLIVVLYNILVVHIALYEKHSREGSRALLTNSKCQLDGSVRCV